MKNLISIVLIVLCLFSSLQAQVTTIATLPGGLPIGTAIKGSALYVSDYTGSKIVKLDLAQPIPVTPVTVLNNISNPTGLLVIGDYLYFNTEGNIPGLVAARSARINLTNPSPTIERVMSNTIDDAQAYARVGDTLYISSANNGIFRVLLNQPFPQAGVQISNQKASGLALRGNDLYYGLYSGDKVSKINRHQPNPSPETVVSGLAGPDGLTFSGNFLYVSESTGSRIVKFDVTQPSVAVETVASSLAGPSLTVFDGLSIYFGQQGNGNVSRLSVNTLSFSPPTPVCVTETAALRTGGSPLGGTYSGQFVTNSGNGETFSFNAQAAGPGTYTVTYTNGALTSTASITVTALPTVSAAGTNISCAGLSNGQAMATGSAGLSYLWSNGATTSAISNLAAGTYTVTVTNIGGCQASATATITAPPALQLSTSTTPNTGTMNNGTATASATGGTVPYAYAWNNGTSTAVNTGLATGTYTVTVTDANGCTQTATATVQQQAVIPGDVCSSAININSLFGTAIGVPVVSTPYDNTGANTSGDPSVDLMACFFQSDPLQHTLWYSFTGNGNSYLIRTVQGSATNYIQDGDIQAALFSGSCANPVFVTCNEDETGSMFNINFEVNTVVGQEYRLMLDGYGGLQGEFCLEVTNISQTAISFPALGTVCSNVTAPLGGATPTGGIYSGPGVTDNGNGSSFSFNPTAAGGPGTYTITYTLPNGSSANAPLTVTAAPVISVFGFMTSVNVPPHPLPDPGAGPAGGVYSGVGVLPGNIFDAGLAGVGVHLLTYTFTDANGCTGTGTGTISVNPAPHDACNDANNINSLFGAAYNVPQTSGLQNNTGYTSNGDPAVSTGCFFNNDPLQHTIWYTFTGDGNTYRIRSVQCNATNYITDGDTQVAVFTGDCNNPTQVACNDDESGSSLNISVDIATQAGQTYRMLVDGYGGAQGEFCLEVTNLTTSAITEIGQTGIRLFPNPTTGVVQLANVNAHHVQVFDNKGRLVMQVAHPGNQIDISAVPAGMYFLKIAEGDRVYTARVVKE